jgi:hypothetical protein
MMCCQVRRHSRRQFRIRCCVFQVGHAAASTTKIQFLVVNCVLNIGEASGVMVHHLIGQPSARGLFPLLLLRHYSEQHEVLYSRFYSVTGGAMASYNERPNTNTAFPAATAMYCCPSTRKLIGLDSRLLPVWKSQSTCPV